MSGFTVSELKGAAWVLGGGVIIAAILVISGVFCTGGTEQLCPDNVTIKATCVDGFWQESGLC